MPNEDDYWKVVSQRSCGREYKAGLRIHSGNYRMTSLQAAILRGQLAALRRNAPIINRNGLALDKAVAAAPGVHPLRRNRHITRQCGYAFGFLFDREKWDGVDGRVFRRALAAELGVGFFGPYTPLPHSEVYSPQMKKRHKLSRDYLKAITPSRWNLPVVEELWRHRAVLATWSIYGLPPKRARLLTEAISKLYENRKDLAGLRIP